MHAAFTTTPPLVPVPLGGGAIVRLRRRAAGPARLLAATGRESWPLLVPIGAITAVSMVGLAMSPMLLDHPLLLVVLTPKLLFVSLAATKVNWLLLLVVAVLRQGACDPLHYVLGRRHGAAVVTHLRSRRRSRVVTAVSARLRRWLPGADTARAARVVAALLLLAWPNGRHHVIAGASEVRAVHAAAANVIGSSVYLGTVILLARQVS